MNNSVMKMTVSEIAAKVGGAVEGDPDLEIVAPADVRTAGPGEISFVANPRYASAAENTTASAVIVTRDWDRPCPATLVKVDNPDSAFAEIAAAFAPPPVNFEPGIHPAAVVAEDVEVGEGTYVGPCCVLEPGTRVGARCILQGGCYLGHGVSTGDDCRFYPNVSIREYCTIGNRTILHNGVVVGSDGFGYAEQAGARSKIPQIGIVSIGDDVEIGSNTTIDRARFGKTSIGNGVKIDNLVQIAHNVKIGDNAVIVAQVGISGSTSIGERTILAGQAGITGHLTIGSDVIVGAQSGVNKNIKPGTFVLGSPAYSHEKTKKIFAALARLPALKQQIADIVKRLASLEDKAG